MQVALFVCYNLQWLLQTAQPDWNLFKIIPAVWLITTVHDWQVTWFDTFSLLLTHTNVAVQECFNV